MPFWLRAGICLFGAAGIAAGLTPLSIRLAPVIGAMDIPRDGRRMHTRATPRYGGLALFGAFLLLSPFCNLADAGLLRLIWGATLLVSLGTLDDVFRLSAPLKLSVQLLAATLAVGNDADAPATLTRVIFCLLMINAHNMIDGLDGLLVGVSGIEALALGGILFLQGETDAALLATVAFGACLGYLPFNRHPAKTFSGDTGSQFLGLLMGMLALRVRTDAAPLGWLIPFLATALPLSDLLFAVIRRLLRGKNPFEADRGHWHHRLSDLGMGQPRVCFWLCLIAANLGAVAVLLCRAEWYGFAAYAALLAAGVIALLGTFSPQRTRRTDA